MIDLLIALSVGAHPPKIVPAGEGTPIEVPFHPAEQLLRAEESTDGLAFYVFTVPPGTAGAPPHVHAHEDEYFYVLSGEASVLSEGEVVTLGPGGFAALTRDHLHAFWNAGEAEAVLLMSTTDGFQAFFDAVAREARADLSPPEMGALVGRLAAERGITIRMDAVPEEARRLYGLE